MYTANIIEALNRQYRKVTKTESVFPSDQSLEKMLYLASENIINDYSATPDWRLRRTVIFIIKKWTQNSIGIYSIAKNLQSYSGGRVWAEPTKKGRP